MADREAAPGASPGRQGRRRRAASALHRLAPLWRWGAARARGAGGGEAVERAGDVAADPARDLREGAALPPTPGHGEAGEGAALPLTRGEGGPAKGAALLSRPGDGTTEGADLPPMPGDDRAPERGALSPMLGNGTPKAAALPPMPGEGTPEGAALSPTPGEGRPEGAALPPTLGDGTPEGDDRAAHGGGNDPLCDRDGPARREGDGGLPPSGPPATRPVAGAVDLTAPARRPRRRLAATRYLAGRLSVWLFVTLPLVVLATILAGLILTGQPLTAPARLTALAEARASALARSLLGEGAVLHAAGGADLVVEEGLVPRVRLRGLALDLPGAPGVATVDELRVALDPGAMLAGQVAPRRVSLRGVRLDLTRGADGAVRLGGADLGTMAAPGWGGGPQGASPALAALRALLAEPGLAALREARIDGLSLRLTDAATGQSWLAEGAGAALTRAGGEAQAEAQAQLEAQHPGAAPTPAGALSIRLRASETGPAALIAASLDGVPAAAMAAQHPALGWLSLLDAPVSGAVQGGVDPLGNVAPLELTLSTGGGAIRPGGGAPPIPLTGASARLTYDPARARLHLADLSLDSRALRLRGRGHADVTGPNPMRPEALVGQITLTDVAADPAGIFATPAHFDRGTADLRLRLDPLRLDIGQVSLLAGAERLTARGQLRANPEGWAAALDFDAGEIALDRLLALWPVGLAAKTRDWVEAHITTGSLYDARGALRLAPGAEPVLSLSYAFRGTEVRVVPSLPPVQDGAGYATIDANAHVLVVDRGTIAAPGRPGEAIDVARTVLSVPDIRAHPARAEAALHIGATIPAALSLLDQPPFEILKKAGHSPDLAQGQAQIVARVGLPLVENLPKDQVDYRIDGVLRAVRSTALVPGRVLAAERLTLAADRATGLAIAGRGTLSGVPFDARWHMGLTKAEAGRSDLTGTIEITPAGLDAFGILLPKGMVTGKGQGRLDLTLIRGKDGPFTFTTDTIGLTMAIPQIAWRKPPGSAGSLEVKGALRPRASGLPPRIDRLAIKAPGLSAEGSLNLRRQDAGGGMERLTLPKVSVADWFTGSVRLDGRAKGQPPAVAITGGRADLTRMPAQRATPAAGGGTMPVVLDRLQVTRGFHLTGVSADLTLAGGARGPFSGRLNGKAPIRGTVAPGPGGRSEVRLSADDAGATLAAAGIFDRARGGRLDMVLTPARGAVGHYDGRLLMRGVTVAGGGMLGIALDKGHAGGADTGAGMAFDSVEASFKITPQAIEITQGAAVGPRIGLSAAGIYLPGDRSLHIKGVISPVFALNPGGAASGEALFGFTYRLGGTAAAPEVEVNPASILAPGALREVFRSPAPTLDNVRLR